MDVVESVKEIFATDQELLAATDWDSFQWRLDLHELIAHEQGQSGTEGPLMSALALLHTRFEEDVILDPQAPRGGPQGRQGRPPSSAVVRGYAARLNRVADLLQEQEAVLGGMD
jgi:hypothetical protein